MNKLVIITGASSGIGAAIAKVFSAAGYSLGLLARNLEAMEKLNLPNTLCISIDVTNFDAFKKAIQECEAKFGSVDCLINNAGFAKGGEFTEVDHVDHLSTVNINLQGVINGIEAVLPGMRERKKIWRPAKNSFCNLKEGVKKGSNEITVHLSYNCNMFGDFV